jgi:hypothetical protein
VVSFPLGGGRCFADSFVRRSFSFTQIRVRISNCYFLHSVMVDGMKGCSGHSAGFLSLDFHVLLAPLCGRCILLFKVYCCLRRSVSLFTVLGALRLGLAAVRDVVASPSRGRIFFRNLLAAVWYGLLLRSASWGGCLEWFF